MILAINLWALKLFAAQELPEPKVASVYYEASDGFPLLCPITFSDKWTSLIHILWQTLPQLSEMLCEEPFFIVILNLFLFNLMLRLFKREKGTDTVFFQFSRKLTVDIPSFVSAPWELLSL